MDHPYEEVNFISRYLFCWLNKLLSKGYKEKLRLHDLPPPSKHDSSRHLADSLSREWQCETEASHHAASLLAALWRVFWRPVVVSGLIFTLKACLEIAQPLLLQQFLHYFEEHSSMVPWKAYVYGGATGLCSVSIVSVHNPAYFNMEVTGIKMTVALSAILYNKVLRMKSTSLKKSSTGQMMTILSTDMNSVQDMAAYLPFVVIAPLQSLVYVYLLWTVLDVYAFVGAGFALLLIPAQLCMGKLFAFIRRRTAAQTDKRVNIMNELIASIRVIKYYCWQPMYTRLVSHARRQELFYIKCMAASESFVMVLIRHSSKLFVVLTVMIMTTYSDKPLDPSTLYPAIAILYGLGNCISLSFLRSIMVFATATSSMGRIQESSEEWQEEGSVGGAVYWQYFKAPSLCGAAAILFILIVGVLVQTVYVFWELWLARWSNYEDSKFPIANYITKNHTLLYSLTESFDEERSQYQFGYLWLSAALLAIAGINTCFTNYTAISAAESLHNKMFGSVLSTAIRFFDTNSSGRILNRFTKDQSIVDERLPWFWNIWFQLTVALLGAFALACIGSFWLLLPLPVLALISWKLKQIYIASSRELKRIEATTRSVVFGQLTCTLQGLQTVRAYRVQQSFIDTFQRQLDTNFSAMFIYLCVRRWFAVRMDYLFTGFLTITIIVCAVCKNSLTGGLAGAIITSLTAVILKFQYCIRITTDIENMVSKMKNGID